MNTKGIFYLIPSLLGDTSVGYVLPENTVRVIRSLSHFIVEDLRTARRFLKKAGYPEPFDTVTFSVFNEHTGPHQVHHFLEPIHQGHHTGLLSEAGMPCIADPGAILVALAHQTGIQVVPLSGSSAIMLALMASGFNGQNFAFNGYLPIEKHLRTQRIREIERTAYDSNQTQIFIETPYRNHSLLESLIITCKPSTQLAIACNLTQPDEQIMAHNISEWNKIRIDLHKKPAVFLLSR